MKKTYVWIGIGIILIVAAIFNLNMDINNKGHYFGNGIVCGIGLSVIVTQILKIRKLKNKI
ncbi:MAG: hypothetical protein J0H55_03995 [Chitinophagaceae bacterium]|nr:hypothetical protein [Chitinophagaceae bacterium]